MDKKIEKFKDSFYSQIPPAITEDGLILVDVKNQLIDLWRLSTGKKSYEIQIEGKYYEFVRCLNSVKLRGRKSKAA